MCRNSSIRSFHPLVRAIAALLGLTCAAPAALALPPGGDGVRITIPVSGTDDTAYAATVDPAGNVVMAGATSNGQSALASITRSGQINPTFGPDGFVLYNLSASTDSLLALVRMSDGRYVRATRSRSARTSIVAAGVTDADGPPHVALARYTADGAPDAGFGSGGIVDINAGSSSNGSSEAHALPIQPDGKLPVAGYATGTGNSDVLVMRLHADGAFDTTFGSNGITRTPIGGGEDIANAMALEPDGRIVVAGTSVIDNDRHDFLIARYTPTGTLDATFGSGGITTTAIGPGDDVACSLLRMPWGRYVVAGSSRISTSAAGTDLALVSYNADGSIDRYFGDLGIRTVDVSSVSTMNDAVYALANDIDGEHFWAVGTAAPSTTEDFMAVEFGLDDTIFRHGFDTDTSR